MPPYEEGTEGINLVSSEGGEIWKGGGKRDRPMARRSYKGLLLRLLSYFRKSFNQRWKGSREPKRGISLGFIQLDGNIGG